MTDVSPKLLADIAQLRARLSDPEPMCLVVVAIAPSGPPSHDSGTPEREAVRAALLEELGRRLGGSMRPYDELRLLADGRFIVILPTLADAVDLEGRVAALFRLASGTYEVGGSAVAIDCLVGAAVRQPGEDAASLLGRAGEALARAADCGGQGPILA